MVRPHFSDGNPSPEESQNQKLVSVKYGRPRTPEVIQRDNRIYSELDTAPITREHLAEITGFAEQEVYLSLSRLKRKGLAEHSHENGRHVWRRIS